MNLSLKRQFVWLFGIALGHNSERTQAKLLTILICADLQFTRLVNPKRTRSEGHYARQTLWIVFASGLGPAIFRQFDLHDRYFLAALRLKCDAQLERSFGLLVRLDEDDPEREGW
jgi:hypothetical protein